jgi:preprotein translocase subunit SecG
MTTRPSELFAISAAALIVFSLLSRRLADQGGVSIAMGDVGYVFSASAVSLVMASFLCFFAVIYSIWPLLMSQRAGIWHYWITTASIIAFWICFYLFILRGSSDSSLTAYRKAYLFGQFGSMLVMALAQTIFVFNFVIAIIRLLNFTARR